MAHGIKLAAGEIELRECFMYPEVYCIGRLETEVAQLKDGLDREKANVRWTRYQQGWKVFFSTGITMPSWIIYLSISIVLQILAVLLCLTGCGLYSVHGCMEYLMKTFAERH